MPADGKEIFGAVIAVSLVVILLSSVIVIVIINYRRKQERHNLEKKNLVLAFENEKIKMQTEVEEETRQNLATELHDNIGQIMSLTNVILASIDLADHTKTGEKIGSARELVLRSIREMRQLTKLVQGQNILSAGLRDAIEQEIKWLQRNDYYEVSCVFAGDLENRKNEDKDLVIFRLFQESLHNIVKHAEATAIRFMIALERDLLTLEIEDNGKGFDLDDAGIHTKGMGINNMRKRVDLLRGQIQFESIPYRSTIIRFLIPYSPDDAKQKN